MKNSRILLVEDNPDHQELTLMTLAENNVLNEMERESATVEALKRALSGFKLENADVVCTISNQKTIVDHINMPLMPPT